MKKETIKTIAIIVLLIFSIASILFAFAQKVKADQNAELAQYAAIETNQQREIARAAQRAAEENTVEAQKQAEVMNKMLEDCKTRK